MLDHALTLDPGLVQACYTRALLNIEEEKPAAAVEDLRRYLDREPNDTRALAHLGRVDEARRAGDQFLRRHPTGIYSASVRRQMEHLR